ncbi:HIT domain-containing protein [Nitrincola tapanii]|uniref:HIT domain-containing protein n=1 Tax=Nitrincola tapanii TaxID=1708751 RepID=A0A5A9W333_9GAMM|nr:HIT domain-containing protein [Nitrincola tapanii]KAA0875107.1 HIT domain-containing protein [Nitrincola tapanii]
MDELELEFELHPRLAADTFALGDFPLSRLLLMNDAHYPWFILVPRRAGVTEIYHLSSQEQQQLILESSALSQTLADLFQARKMNVAALGNMVPQLHLHHVVRYEDDIAWPGPVWGVAEAKPYTLEEAQQIRQKLAALLLGEMDFHWLEY